MQSINVNIEGDFWDSFIYKGRLMLFNFNNGIKICDWDLICEYIASKTKCYLGVYYGLQKGNKLYEIDINEQELEIVKYQFDILSNTDIYINKSELQNFIIKEIDSPFLEISNDIEVFNDVLYCASDRGLESFRMLFDGENPLIDGKKSNTIWDNAIIGISTSHGGRMAL